MTKNLSQRCRESALRAHLSVVVICSSIDEPVFTFQFPDTEVRLITSLWRQQNIHHTNDISVC